jgi:hypothetical protein
LPNILPKKIYIAFERKIAKKKNTGIEALDQDSNSNWCVFINHASFCWISTHQELSWGE